ncbi:MAG: efflux RND transporter periplasmic adaptor subunit [Bacteroidetes bacterium]|nr:efflux RND transporter periplasmic adaptor subunit [Bacteroidota bacterium]
MRTTNFIPRLIIAVLVGIGIAGCSPSEDTPGEKGSTTDSRIEPVRVMQLEHREIARRISSTAQLLASREVHLAPATPGRIDKIHVDVGHRVKEGQLLVEMDRTQLQQALVQLRNLETDYQRLDTLRKVGSVSQYQYDQLVTQYEITKSNVAFLRENTTLRAPFSGTVSGKYYEDGEMYSGAPNTAVGKAAVLSLVNTDRLKVLINVAESYYPHITRGMTATIRPDVYPDREFRGTVTMVYPTIDPATRTFVVEISVANPDGVLRPGMFARAEMLLDRVQALVAPAIAVMKLQGSDERYVFLEKEGKAHRVVVEIGDRHDDMLELISGEIRPGDRLIIAGQSRLVDQSPVTVRK